MNIYIYGNHSFKKEIHETLEHSNIKFKLDAGSIINEIDNLAELKKTIKENPKDIYLIDDEKIIKKNSINEKIKFFAPKDGIEEEFLLDSGIADLSINTLSEIPKYILRKHEEEKEHLDPNIQSSIANIVDEAYENEKETIELDDELSQLLAKEEIEEVKEEKTIDQKEENLDDIFNMPMDVDFGIPEHDFEKIDDSLDISKEELISIGLVAKEDYEQLEKYTLALFERGTQMAKERGLILVDTKYEFGKKDMEEVIMQN